MRRPSGPWWAQLLLASLFLFLLVNGATSSNDGNFTTKHEQGRCAMRGQCGKKSLFGSELPCPDNSPAQTPDKDTRRNLVEICGDKWSDVDICCDDDQVSKVYK